MRGVLVKKSRKSPWLTDIAYSKISIRLKQKNSVAEGKKPQNDRIISIDCEAGEVSERSEERRTRPINTRQVVSRDKKTTKKQPKNKLDNIREGKNDRKGNSYKLGIKWLCSD